MNLKSLRSVAAICALSLTAVAANAITLTEVYPATDESLDEIASNAIKLHFDVTPDLASWDFADKKVVVKGDNGISVGGILNVGQDWSVGWPPLCFIEVNLDSSITDKGVYTLTIPAGKIIEDGNAENTSAEINVSWSVGVSAQKLVTPAKVTPEKGSTVEKIGKNDIFVYFEGEYTVPEKNYDVPVTLTDANGKVLESIYLYEAYTPATNLTHFNMNLNNEITEDGVYTLTWPQGMIEGKDGSTNDAFSVSWTVFNPAANVGYLNVKQVVPACGEVESIPTAIQLFFHQTPDLNWDVNPPFEYNLTDANGDVVATTTVRGTAWDGSITFYLPAAIEAPGTYTLKIPAGHYTVDGDTDVKNKELTLTWTIKGAEVGGGESNCTYDFEFVSCYPAKGCTYNFKDNGGAYDGVLLNFDGDASYNPTVKPYIEDANGNRTISTSMNPFQGSIRVNFDTNETKLWRSGDYKLVIPAGFAGTAAWKAANYLEGSCNAEVVVPFTYVEDPSLDTGDNGEEFEVSKFALYNGSTLVTDFLANPETVANITGGSTKKFVFASNKNEMSMDIQISVYDVTNGEEEGVAEWMWSAGTFRQQVTSETDVRTINGKNADNEFEVEFSNSRFTLEFLQGHQYRINASVYKQYDGIGFVEPVCYGSKSVYFTGTTKAYEYSPVEIVKVSKEEGDEFETADGYVEITFSAPVTMNDTYTRVLCGQGLGAYDQYFSNEDGTVWTFRPGRSKLAGATGVCDVRFAPRDLEGRALRSDKYYTSGEKNATYITISFYCFLGGKDITSNPADGAVVDELNNFKFTVTGGSGNSANIGVTGMNSVGKKLYITVSDKEGNVVAKILDGEGTYTGTPSGENTIDAQMHLDNAITAPGTYTMFIPGAYFMTGTESNSVGNKPTTYTFYILGEPVPAESHHTVATANVTSETTIDSDFHEIKVSIKSEDANIKEAVLNIEAPDGYTTVYGMNADDFMGGDIDPYYVRRVDTSDWANESDILATGMEKIESVTVPADNKEHTWYLMYGNNGKVNNNTWTLTATHENTTGINFTLVEGEEGAYYTLQGVRVATPGAGVFVKVANGKAVKVIRK